MDAKRYVTVVATIEAPDDRLWDQIIARRIHGMAEELGVRLVDCDWAPDADTIADGVGAEYGTVTVLDLNPPRVSYISQTGVCLKCGEPYIPDSDDDTVHLMREDGEECGGEGVITGGWGLQRS